MKKRNRILLAALFAIAASGIAWLALRSGEPVYRGKTLSAWLRQDVNNWPITYYNPPSDYQAEDARRARARAEAAAAVRHIGTNALPYLIKMAGAKYSPLKFRLNELLDRQQAISFRFRHWMEYQSMATSGFEMLGNEMTPLAPGFIDLLCSHSRSSDPNLPYVAEACLASIGPPAVPGLLPLLTNEDRAVSDHAARTVASIVPRLTYLLKTDANESNRWQMVVELAEIKTRRNVTALTDQTVATNGQRVTEEFEGALTNALNDKSFLVRSAATNALRRIDAAEASKAGVK